MITPFPKLTCYAEKKTSDNIQKIHLVEESQANTWINGQDKAVQNWFKVNSFTPKKGAFLSIPNSEGLVEDTICIIGEGDNLYALSNFAGTLEGEFELVHNPIETESLTQICLGWALGLYNFNRYKQNKTDKNAVLVLPENVTFNRVQAMAEGVTLTRDLVNTPPNDMQPQHLEDICEQLVKKHSATLTVIKDDALVDQDYHAVYAVGKASENRPRVLDMIWGKSTDPKITLVGKGVCFDTGGLDLKSSKSMILMKKDMGGAAQVLGLAHIIMSLNLPIRLRVMVGAVENSVSDNAYRPSDVIQTKKGLSVEITNTDAEGRLVLSDCLTEVSKEKPELIVDFATLTGAARVALGPDLPPVYTNDEMFAHDIEQVSHRFQDPLWHMPLWAPYNKYLDSKIADLVNAASGGFAGSITAALFLQNFVDSDVRWAHIDCYAWTPIKKAGQPHGGEAQGMRAIFHYLEKQYA